MKKPSKEEIYGSGASILFCGLILLILSFLHLRTEVYAEMEGIPVNFGTVDAAFGDEEPAPASNSDVSEESVSIPQETREPSKTTPQQPLVTQNTENTAAIQAEKEKAEKEKAEQQRIAKEKQQQDEINRQMASAFGKGSSTTGAGEGTASSGSGNQGSPDGNAPTGKYEGIGGRGTLDLQGRGLHGQNEIIGPPKESIEEEGVIVVEITVDPQGYVIAAKCRLKGTNIDSPNMRRASETAAKKNRFTVANQSQNQIGTITYRFAYH